MADAPMVLPPGMTALTPVEFFVRFKQIKGDLSHHLVRQLRLMPEKMESAAQADAMAAQVSRQLTERVKALAEQGKVQFAVAANGDPAIFSSHARQMTDDEQQLASALVSYFDTTGTFNESTGEVVDAQSEMANLTAAVVDAAEAAGVADLATLTTTDYAALAIVCDAVKAPPATVIDLLKRALTEIPDSTPETFVKGVLNGLLKHAEENGEGVELVTTALEGVRVAYTTHMIDEVLKIREQIAADPLSGDTKFGEQAAIAFLTYWLQGSPVHPGPDASPLWVLDRFQAWRTAHPEDDTDAFFDFLVGEELREPLALAYRRFREDMAAYQRVLKEQEEQRSEKLADDLKTKFPSASLDDFLTEESPHLLAECASELNASRRIIREILDRWVGAGVISFVRTPKGVAGIVPNDWPVFVNRTERGLCEIFARRFNTMEVSRAEGGGFNVVDKPKPTPVNGHSAPLPPTVPRYRGPGDHSYMRAVEAQYATLAKLHELVNLTSKRAHDGSLGDLAGLDPISLVTNWVADIQSLRQAGTYCWWDECIRAVEHAAAVFPESIALTEDLTDAKAGFWYFLSPRPVQTVSDASKPIAALLWAWTSDEHGKHKSLRITALTPDARGLSVSTVGSWPDGMTLAQALQHAKAAYRETYPALGEQELIGEEKTVVAIEYMLRFFLMGWLWMKERIPVLTRHGVKAQEHNHKRHRKLEARAERLGRPLTDVQVIQLRRRETVRLDDPNVPEAERRRAIEYQCRWIVKGHTRNQWYPSEGRHRPKWIKSYDKGPEDKPLKTPTHTIYAISR